MSSTPAPIFNPRKRPRQSLIADPQQNLAPYTNPGPSGAAPYHDLMPPGGFTNNRNQPQHGRNNTPVSGQGAAFNSRQNSYGSQFIQNKQNGNGRTWTNTQTNNQQTFYNNNNQTQQQSQLNNRQNSQTVMRQSNQPQPGRQQRNSSYGQNNRINPTPPSTGSNLQSSWSKSTGNHTYNNTGNNFNNSNTSNNFINSNTSNNFKDSNTSYTFNNSKTSNNFKNNTNNSNMANFKQTQLPWNKNGGAQSNPNPRFTSQNLPCNNQTDIAAARVNNYGLPQPGMNTKMQYTSGSGNLGNQQGSFRHYNNYSGSTSQRATGQFGSNISLNQAQAGVADILTETDEWDTSFDESTGGMSLNTPKEKMPSKVPHVVSNKRSHQDMGVHLLTVNATGMKRWSKFRDTFMLLFEMFGVLDSAVAKNSTDCKEFILRDDDKNTVKCVFYEIEIYIPKMTRGMPYRVVGTYDKTNDRLKCSSVRAVSDKEKLQGSKLAAISTRTMCSETRGLREM